MFQEPKHDRNGDDEDFVVLDNPSPYQVLHDTLPEIRTNTPAVPLNFPGKVTKLGRRSRFQDEGYIIRTLFFSIDEVKDTWSPLSMLEEDKQRTIRNYEKIIDSLLDVKAKANLRLEMERRLAENDALARKRYTQWEEERKAVAEECQKIAKQ